nr:DUF3223 domain-containing protein [uncultured Arsenicibacter sp.]
MVRPLKIGKNEFKYKKDALAYYKAILNAYNFGESLSGSDFQAVADLLEYDYLNSLAVDEETEQESEDAEEAVENTSDEDEDDFYIKDIQVARVQFNTKCFEVFYADDTSQYISYLMLINNKRYEPEKLFYVACRNSVHADIRAVKQAYFDIHSVKGQVKCQETGILSKWTELAVDHRQPNTFSIIVDRFKEVTNPDLAAIEYTSNAQNQIIFKDENLTERFRIYHKDKAKLRLVRKECNSSRAAMARVKKTTKDLTVSPPPITPSPAPSDSTERLAGR